MSKFLGYIISLIGLVIIALPFLKISFLASIPQYYLIIAGFVLVFLGIVLAGKKEKSGTKQSEEEVPIYAGEGKKRKIVGYRKEK